MPELEITSWDQVTRDPLPAGTEVVYGGQVLDDLLAGRIPAEVQQRMTSDERLDYAVALEDAEQFDEAMDPFIDRLEEHPNYEH